MCQGSHKNSEFPVSKYLNELMKTPPSEVFRCDLVEKFKKTLNEIESRKTELEGILLNGADRVDQTPLDNFTADLRLSLTIDGQPLFYSDTSVYS